MREITLQPGTAVEIDGVRVRAAMPIAPEVGSGYVYDPATCRLVSSGQEQMGRPENPLAKVSTTDVQQC